MAKRIVLGGLVGGVLVLVWGTLIHIALGIKVIPNEDSVMAAMRANLHESGLYLFPAEGAMGSAEQKNRWAEKYQAGPTGILVYHLTGGDVMSKLFLTELASNVAGALMTAFLLSQALAGAASFGQRVLFVALIGIFATVAIDVSYWNRYGFPTNYLLGSFLEQGLGWALAGVAQAWIFGRATA